MRLFHIILFLSFLLFSSSCTTFFRKKITNDNLLSSTEATGIRERASESRVRAKQIIIEANEGENRVKKDLAEKSMTLSAGEDHAARYNRIELNADQIANKSRLNERSSKKIVRINTGTWYTTVWFKLLIGFIVVFLLLILISYITYIAKSWGVLSYVKNINEGLADGMATMINVNKDIDNDSVHEEINRRIRKNKHY